MIVLKKQVFNLTKDKVDKIKKELVYLLIALVIGIIIFKIVFYKENLLNIIKIVASIFWLFLLPGYSLMFYWEEKLDFLERFIIGIALGIALVGTFSYYLGLIGLNLRFHTIILPAILILIGIIIISKRKNHQKI